MLSHTEPLFKELKLLKITDIFTLTKLKFAHKFVNNKLPIVIMGLPYLQQKQHGRNTRVHVVESSLLTE